MHAYKIMILVILETLNNYYMGDVEKHISINRPVQEKFCEPCMCYVYSKYACVIVLNFNEF